MDAAEVTDVCRLCPSSGGGQNLLNVFDETVSYKYNIKEVIFMNTGIEILENDLVSKKICQRCCNILYKMYDFRLDAAKQDQKLKDKCSQLLGDKGIRLPNTCITIKREKSELNLANKKMKTDPDGVQLPTNKVQLSTDRVHLSSLATTSASKEDLKKRLHPSVADVFRNYPHYKLPKKCFETHVAPVVSLYMGEVESYFKKRKLNLRKFIYKPRTENHVSQKVSKKKTSLSTDKKTVAPIKISKKLLENYDEPGTSTGIFLSTPNEENRRKRKISSASDRSTESKAPQHNQATSQPEPTSSVKICKPTINETNTVTTEIKTLPSLPNLSNGVPETPHAIRAPSPERANLMSGNSRSPSPAAGDPLSEDSRDSYLTNISKATTSSSSSKPDFMESFGLTPTVTATKSHTLLVCSLCGSVHHNAYELKKHSSKHMVCQFCKKKFKTIEAKQNHVDKYCQIKKVMNSPGPVVKLEKIHLDLNVRKKYRNAFTNFELIPGLIELTPVEQVILQAASPPPPTADDAVIVLSDDDDDETTARFTDPLSGIPTPSEFMPPPAAENVVYNTVSIVRPDIRIKNNTILNTVAENMTDKQLLKQLIGIFKPQQPTTAEKMLQTDLPASKDIKVNNSDGSFEFKNLKGQLATYKIPITVSNGPLHASYKFKNNPKANKCMALWDDLPVINIFNRTASSLVNSSQVQSSKVTISTAPVVNNIPSSSCSSLSSTNIQTAPSVPSSSGLVINNISPINTSNSATPLLQNYALSMVSAPVIINPIPIPRTYINSALNNTASTSNRTSTSAIGNNIVSRPSSSVITSYNQLQPASSFNVHRFNNSSVINTLPTPSTLGLSGHQAKPTSSSHQNRSHTPIIGSSATPRTSVLPEHRSQPTNNFNLNRSQNISIINTSTTPSTSLLSAHPAQSTSGFGVNRSCNTSVMNTSVIQSTSSAILTRPPTNSYLINISPLITTASVQPVASTLATNSTTSTSGINPSATPPPNPHPPPPLPETSKFRVKSVWELQ